MLYIDDIFEGMHLKVVDERPTDEDEGPGWNPRMDAYLGKVMTVRFSGRHYVHFLEDRHNRDGEGWLWDPRWLSMVDEDEKIKADDVADNASIERLFS